MAKLVCGVGTNDGKYPTHLLGKILKEYDLWKCFLTRCYTSKYQEKFPTYAGCLVSENFQSYSYFYEWCQRQIGFGVKGYQLDKDLILRENKVYSETTCVFLPQELNSLLTSRKKHRGNLPIGVCADRGRFVVKCHTDKLSNHVGYFDTSEEAFQAYKQVKEAFIKQQAEKWKASIDPRAYEALMAYTILITD